jgi:hypothetical protein
MPNEDLMSIILFTKVPRHGDMLTCRDYHARTHMCLHKHSLVDIFFLLVPIFLQCFFISLCLNLLQTWNLQHVYSSYTKLFGTSLLHKIYASSNAQKFAPAYTKKFTFNHLCKKLHFPFLIANSNSCVVIVASIKTHVISEET